MTDYEVFFDGQMKTAPAHRYYMECKSKISALYKIKDDAKACRAKGFLVKIVNGKYVGQWTRRNERWYKEW